MDQLRDISRRIKLEEGNPEKMDVPTSIHPLCHGGVNRAGGPNQYFELDEPVSWELLMELFFPSDDVVCMPAGGTHLFANCCRGFQKRCEEIIKSADNPFTSIYSWRIDVENEDAIFAAGVYYQELISDQTSSLADRVFRRMREELQDSKCLKLDVCNAKCVHSKQDLVRLQMTMQDHKCSRATGCVTLKRLTKFDDPDRPAAVAWPGLSYDALVRSAQEKANTRAKRAPRPSEPDPAYHPRSNLSASKKPRVNLIDLTVNLARVEAPESPTN